MKKLIAPILLLTIIPLFTTAQSTFKNKPWHRPIAKMRPEGFWVAEGNLKSPRTNTISFYNANNELVGKQEIKGKKLKLDQYSTRHMLNEMLEKALDGWMPEQNASKEKKPVSDTTRS